MRCAACGSASAPRSPCRSSSASRSSPPSGACRSSSRRASRVSPALIAVVVLTWMLFWMRRQGRAMKGELEHGVDIALAGGSIIALAGLAFVSVAREGLETVLFLYAIGASSGPVVQTLIAAFAGLLVAAGIGWAIFRGRHPDRPAALLHHHRHRPDLRLGRAGRVRRPRVRRGRAHHEQRRGLRRQLGPARVEPARFRPRRPVRLPLDADPARGRRLPGVPDPGAHPLPEARPAAVGSAGPGRQLIGSSVRRAGHPRGRAGRRPGRTGRSSRRTG